MGMKRRPCVSDAVKEVVKDWVVTRGADHGEAAIKVQSVQNQVVLNLREAPNQSMLFGSCISQMHEQRKIVSSRYSLLYILVSDLLRYFLICSQ